MKKLQIKINCCVVFSSKFTNSDVRKPIEISANRKAKNTRNSFQRKSFKLSLSILVKIRNGIEKRTNNKLELWNSANCQWFIPGLK